MRRCSDLSHKCVAAFGILLILGRIGRIKSADTSYKVCETDKCKEVAEQLQDSLDESVDPCDNVYNFVCGGWIQKHPIPADAERISVFKIMGSTANEQIRQLLETEDQNGNFQPAVLASKIYKMCTAIKQRNIDGIAELDELVKAAGDWPMLIPEDKENYEIPWQEIAKKLDLYFFGRTMYSIDVALDVENTAKYALYLGHATFPLTLREMLEPNEKARNIYRTVLRGVVLAFLRHRETDIPDERIDEDLSELLYFEIQLANISASSSDAFLKTTIGNFQNAYEREYPENANPATQIDWLDVIRNYFSTVQVSFQPSDEILIYGPSYFLQLAKILHSTSPRTLVNFVQWQFIRRAIFYTSDSMADILFAAEKSIYGLKERKPLSQMCLKEPNLDIAISYEYIKKFFPTGTKTDVMKIFNELKDVTKEEVKDSTWMDGETKSAAKEKLEAIKAQIGFPDWYNEKNIVDYYSNFNLGSTYLSTIKNLYAHHEMIKLKKLGTQVAHDTWKILPSEDNTGFNLRLNALILPAAHLQSEVYNADRPQSMNYGSVGFLIGLELFRALDNLGGNYDKNGNLNPWWTQQTHITYNELTKCFVDQYNRYTIPHQTVHIDGNLTLVENIAADAAFRTAWRTWQAYKEKVGEEVADIRLPKLEKYSGDQLFFISAVHTYCDNVGQEIMEHDIKTQHFAPWHTRMVGALSNLPDYSKTFGCNAEKSMNPTEKCTLW